jgi:hypothetical protein
VGRYVHVSYTELRRSARIRQFLPAMAERFAIERLIFGTAESAAGQVEGFRLDAGVTGPTPG